MKISLNWLESYFVTKPDWDMVWNKLTMAGIEVEGIEAVAPPFSGVVVAAVVECVKHPEADKLNLCTVDSGDGALLQIICGASNVKAGVKVPCARIGAVLPDGLHIAERKMRGLTSHGMLCSGVEIACPDGVDGLLILPDEAPVGESIRDYLGLDDQIVEFKITPNRGDCLSIEGLLREIAALTAYPLHRFNEKAITPQLADQIKIVMDAGNACPNYLALVIKGINNRITLPEEITKRLTRSGLRSVSPVVDITNYVMLELGQPLHAFDLKQVGDQLQIRMARTDETIKLLDGKFANLSTDTLVICNSSDQPIAIAGVMGGFDSGVTQDTTDLVLESAFFTPVAIAGKAKKYGVNSDAAYRYERGVDSQLQMRAIAYVADLITRHCGGKVGVVSRAQAELAATPPAITLDYNELNRVLGCVIPVVTVGTILTCLGFKCVSNTNSITAIPPSYRFDIAFKHDLIEEIARVYGYDNILPILPIASYTINGIDKLQQATQTIKSQLITLGYNEIIGYAFIEDKYEQMLGDSGVVAVELQNPIAGLNVMRTSLIADLIKALVSNLKRGHKHIKLFELARVFHGEDIDTQPLRVSGLVYGNYMVPGWSNCDRLADFFDVKHDVSAIIGTTSEISYIECGGNDVFHSGRCALIMQGGNEVGVMGQLHPKLGQELGLSQLPYLFELDLASLSGSCSLKAHEVSKFQKTERDLAFYMAKNVVVGDVLTAIKAAQVNYLIDSWVFDVFADLQEQVNSLVTGVINSENVKSVAIRFVFQAHKNLVDDEINTGISQIISLVTSKFPAQLRQ